MKKVFTTHALLIITLIVCAQKNKKLSKQQEQIISLNTEIQALTERTGTGIDYIFWNIDLKPRKFLGQVRKITLIDHSLKSVLNNEYSIVSTGDSVIFTFDKTGKETHSAYFSYNSLSHKIEKTYAGNLLADEFQYTNNGKNIIHTIYEYNSNKILIRKAFTSSRNKDTTYVKYALNSNGRPTAEYYLNKKDTIYNYKWHYDSKGNRKNFLKYSHSSNKILKSTFYEYDNINRIINLHDSLFISNNNLGYLGYNDTIIAHRNFFYNKESIVISKEEITEYIAWDRKELPYNPLFNIQDTANKQINEGYKTEMREIKYDYFRKKLDETQPKYKTIIAYNEEGNIISMQTNPGSSQIEIKYTYDHYKNWTSMTFFSNQVPKSQILRIIEYYE